MKYIQVIEIGRCAQELNRYPVLEGNNPQMLLAMELESYWNQQETIILPVQGEVDSYAVMRKPSLIGGKQTIKVRVIDVEEPIAYEDTREMLPVIDHDAVRQADYLRSVEERKAHGPYGYWDTGAAS